MNRLAGISVLVFTTLFATQLLATPHEIRIIRGTFVQPAEFTGRFALDGTAGLAMEGTVSAHSAGLPWEQCFRFACLPGDVVTLQSSYGTVPPVLTGSGLLSLLGQTYGLWTPGEAFANFGFHGAFTLPALPPITELGRAEVSAPFTFSGFLYIPSRFEPGTYDVHELHGSGVATATIERHPITVASWVVGSISYEFEPRGDAVVR
jgi:hypothetical protein